MDLLTIALLVGGGLVCGIINVIGGGGSLLSLPIFLAVGLPADVANATNRVAIVCQDISALLGFRRQKINPWPVTSRLALPVVLGAVAGAWCASNWLTETVMNILILLLVAGMIVLVVFKRDSWEKVQNSPLPASIGISGFLLFFAIGFYGGFIQAGFTYLVMAVLVMKMGSSLVTSDAVKLLLNLMIIPFVLAVFIWHHQVNWSAGFVMGLGSIAGGYLGTRLASRLSPAWTRRILIFLLLLSGLYILFFRVL